MFPEKQIARLQTLFITAAAILLEHLGKSSPKFERDSRAHSSRAAYAMRHRRHRRCEKIAFNDAISGSSRFAGFDELFQLRPDFRIRIMQLPREGFRFRQVDFGKAILDLG